jgi:hypothetical protein
MVVNTFIDSNVRLKIFRKFLKVGDSVPFKSGVPVVHELSEETKMHIRNGRVAARELRTGSSTMT